MTFFEKPNWAPQVPEGSRILVVGASGGIGNAVVKMLVDGSSCIVGAQGRNMDRILTHEDVIPLQASLATLDDCEQLIDCFVEKTGGIDGIVILSGSLASAKHWSEISDQDWTMDINSNLSVPFYLAKAAFAHMVEKGGNIIFNGTESALHGGGSTSFAYGVAKQGTECMVKGLARDGAKHNIRVNGVRFGFIESGFHERWQGKTHEDLKKRSELVPLKRAGHVDEAAALVTYLLSGYSGFITGQIFALTGGDWL